MLFHETQELPKIYSDGWESKLHCYNLYKILIKVHQPIPYFFVSAQWHLLSSNLKQFYCWKFFQFFPKFQRYMICAILGIYRPGNCFQKICIVESINDFTFH